MPEADQSQDVTALTVQLLSAYLSNNSVGAGELADLIRTTRSALVESAVPAVAEETPETFTPAVSVRKSVGSPEHILSLIDGKPYKTLKRHLASHGLTPDDYRSRYNLPASYPLVAPEYAARRRAVAQKIGLGSRKPAQAEKVQADDTIKTQTAPSSPRRKAKVEEAGAASTPAEQAGVSEAVNAPVVAAPEAKSAPKRGRKPAAAAKSAAGKAPAAKAAASDAAAGEQAAPSKARKRLGLFNSSSSDQGADAGTAAQDGGEAKAASAKPRRKARTPQSE